MYHIASRCLTQMSVWESGVGRSYITVVKCTEDPDSHPGSPIKLSVLEKQPYLTELIWLFFYSWFRNRVLASSGSGLGVLSQGTSTSPECLMHGDGLLDLALKMNSSGLL